MKNKEQRNFRAFSIMLNDEEANVLRRLRCEYCINIHVKNALEEGASREEILEAASVAVAYGGSPSMAYVATSVMKALDAFE